MHIADYIKTGLPYWPNWLNHIILKCNCFGSLVYGRSFRRMLSPTTTINPEQRLVEMVNYAISHVPYYRNRYGKLQINSKTDFEQKIGFIDKNEVLSHWDEFLSDEYDPTKAFFGTTSGSDGQPMKIILPKNRYIYSLAPIHRIWMKFGWNYETRGVFRNHRIESGRDYIINPIMKEVIFDTFKMNEPYATICWKTLRKYGVEHIHAYPSAFFQFCKLCRNQNLDLAFIKTAFLASECVTNEQDALFKDMGIRICLFYGHSECLILAGNTPESPLLRIDENYGLCELVDSNDNIIRHGNVSGQMVGTTYFNKLFPLIRYKTGDYSQYANNLQDTPRYLTSVQGHRDNCIIYRHDNTYTTTSALTLHGNVNCHIDGLQYIQETKGYLIACIIKNKEYTNEDETYLKQIFSTAMGGDEFVEIRYVTQLRMNENHKFAQLISNL
ncbi:MAG: phenylacetate--CoA ligase family protein [Paludibacteraceae bacterium]|nr:phenylacetate--CoA ligase family protein [Paludibacteraceae bacterium]